VGFVRFFGVWRRVPVRGVRRPKVNQIRSRGVAWQAWVAVPKSGGDQGGAAEAQTALSHEEEERCDDLGRILPYVRPRPMIRRPQQLYYNQNKMNDEDDDDDDDDRYPICVLTTLLRWKPYEPACEPP